MQQIQIARGSLSIRKQNTAYPLLKGELFLDYKDVENDLYDLYVGTGKSGDNFAKKIGGNSGLTFEGSITSLPTSPVLNGVYYASTNIDVDGKGTTEVPQFEIKKGDLIIYVGGDYTIDKDDSTSPKASKGWIKVGGGGSTAYDVEFDKTYTNYNATNVQAALVEVDRNKLAYGGELTLTENQDTYTKAEIFGNTKAGYYYYVKKAITADGTEVKKGDFIAVTSTVTTNDADLTVDDVTLTKIPGGVHSAEDLEATMGDRHTNAGTYWTTDKEDVESFIKDDDIKNVQGVLNRLTISKADLDKNGKIPLTELPNTLIQSMEYQGTVSIPTDASDADKTEEKLIAAVLKAKTEQNDEDEPTPVVGDYWIYTGPTIAFDKDTTNIESSEGRITTGDWIVYNGDVGGKTWSVIDNTSAVKDILVKSTEDTETTTLNGTITFSGSNRVDDEDEKLTETKLTIDSSEGTTPTVTVETPNAVLVTDDNAKADGTIYKAGKNKTLEASGLKENATDKTLEITEENGIVLTGAKKTVPAEGEGEATVTSLDKVTIKQNEEQTTDIELTLPKESGTLARLDDLNQAFSEGEEYYIPRYTKVEDGADDELTLTSSPISLSRDTSTDSGLHGIIFHKADADGKNGSTLNNDVEILFSSSGEASEEKLVHRLPATSGYLLNTNSVIDCGEFTETGFTTENEGAVNNLYNIDGSTTTKTTSDDYKNGKLHNGVASVEADEVIEAYISED